MDNGVGPVLATTIYRYEVPVDGDWHELVLSSPVVHVAARDPGVVELWSLHDAEPARPRAFRAYGTGHPLPELRLRHVGSVVTAGGRLVWHLMERSCTCPEIDVSTKDEAPGTSMARGWDMDCPVHGEEGQRG